MGGKARQYGRTASKIIKNSQYKQELFSFPDRIRRLRSDGLFEEARILEKRYLEESIRKNKRAITARKKLGHSTIEQERINEQMKKRLGDLK